MRLMSNLYTEAMAMLARLSAHFFHARLRKTRVVSVTEGKSNARVTPFWTLFRPRSPVRALFQASTVGRGAPVRGG